MPAAVEDRRADVEEDLIEVLEECFPLATEVRTKKIHCTNTGEEMLTLGELIVKFGPRTAGQFKIFVQDFLDKRTKKDTSGDGEKPTFFWSLLAEVRDVL